MAANPWTGLNSASPIVWFWVVSVLTPRVLVWRFSLSKRREPSRGAALGSITSRLVCTVVLLCYCAIVLLCYCAYCAIVLLCYCAIVLLRHLHRAIMRAFLVLNETN
jgi:hypothetical protein